MMSTICNNSISGQYLFRYRCFPISSNPSEPDSASPSLFIVFLKKPPMDLKLLPTTSSNRESKI